MFECFTYTCGTVLVCRWNIPYLCSWQWPAIPSRSILSDVILHQFHDFLLYTSQKIRTNWTLHWHFHSTEQYSLQSWWSLSRSRNFLHLWNWECHHYCIHQNPPLVSILNPVNLVHTPSAYCFNTDLNITHPPFPPSIYRTSKNHLHLRFLDESCVRVSHTPVQATCHGSDTIATPISLLALHWWSSQGHCKGPVV